MVNALPQVPGIYICRKLSESGSVKNEFVWKRVPWPQLIYAYDRVSPLMLRGWERAEGGWFIDFFNLYFSCLITFLSAYLSCSRNHGTSANSSSTPSQVGACMNWREGRQHWNGELCLMFYGSYWEWSLSSAWTLQNAERGNCSSLAAFQFLSSRKHIGCGLAISTA